MANNFPHAHTSGPGRFLDWLVKLIRFKRPWALAWPAAVVAGLTPVAPAAPIQFRPAEYLQAGGVYLDPGWHAIPCVTDWNGDGRKDLIVGYRNVDKVALYLNTGTDAQPVFASFVHLQAGGADILHPASACGAPAPWVCDYDGDGRRDLLVGTGVEGHVYFYRNTNTDAAPQLAAGVQLRVGAATLSVGYRATPYVHDWDEDGLNDLLCGNGDGLVYFFRNIGTAQSPAYAAATLIQAGGGVLDLGDRSVVRVVDWDGDGIKDLVGSASYNASWCRNIGSNQTPRLEAPRALRTPVAGGSLAPINTSYRMRLELVDWNNDGVLDLLIGDYQGYVFYYEGYHLAFTDVTAQPTGTVTLQWHSAPLLRYHVLAGPSPMAMPTLVATNLPSAGKLTSWTGPQSESCQFYRIQQAD